jgi:soluble lytic murein transglycosylase-like protein
VGDAAAVDALRETPIYKRLVDHPNIRYFQALIDRSARARGLDAALVKAVIAVESAFDPAAVSAKGALGLMQVMPETGTRYGVATDRKRTLEQKLLDPEINLRIGTTYLRDLLALFVGDVTLALAAYNAGEQTVARYANRVPPYPETQEYVKLVQQFYELYRPAPPQRQPTQPARILIPSSRPPS